MARSLIALLSIALSTAALALPADRDLPITVNADQAEFDEGAGRATYSGNVVLVQGALRIEAERLTAVLVDGQVETMRATGDQAVFSDTPSAEQGEVKGIANSIDWALKDQVMVLTGAATLTQSTNTVIGESVIYRQAKGTLEASSDGKGERVQMILTPNNS
ncbi:MAG: lipopolysaccharide transport periplasmic protein LptA [Litorivicinus sp.]